jgi:hypothetical protein
MMPSKEAHGLMNELLVLTVDVFDTHVSSAVTLTADGVVEQLALHAAAPAGTLSLTDVITDSISQGAVASAQRLGILASPEHLVVTHPLHWTSEQAATIHSAVDATGFTPGRVFVRPRPQ